MAKHVLENVFDFDFSILALSSSEPDYKLCIHLNRLLNINLARQEDIDLNAKGMSSALAFPCFFYDDDENFFHYTLLGNRSSNFVAANKVKGAAPSLFDDDTQVDVKLRLVPELAQYDHLLMIKGDGHESLAKSIQPELKKINFVRATQFVDPETLNSKMNLLL